MISGETVQKIWKCHREIDAGKQLLEDIQKEKTKNRDRKDRFATTIKDAFGRDSVIQLGFPMGDNSHRLFDVSVELAESCIRAHIANKTTELAEANEQARIELNKGPQPATDGFYEERAG
jgi:hypothetical protein